MDRKNILRKNEYLQRENAYFSLEACLIMPIVFWTIIFVMYMGFYQYDKCVLQQDLFRMLIRGSWQKFLSNEELAQKMKEEDAKWYYEKYVLCNWENKQLEVGHNEIRIAQTAVFDVKVPLIGKWTTNGDMEICADFTGTRIHPVETIRSCRKLEGFVERGSER